MILPLPSLQMSCTVPFCARVHVLRDEAERILSFGIRFEYLWFIYHCPLSALPRRALTESPAPSVPRRATIAADVANSTARARRRSAGITKGRAYGSERQALHRLDVGGTSVKMGLFTEDGELIGRGSVPTPPLIDSDGYAAVTDGISKVLAASSAEVDAVHGIGLAIPCPVPADGVIRMQANIQINAPGPRGGAPAALPQRYGEVRERCERRRDGRAVGRCGARP